MTFKTKFALIITIFLWASAFVGIRAGLQAYSPEGLALLRYLVASLCMGMIYYQRRVYKRPIPFWDLCALLGIGALGVGLYNITLNYGEVAISSGMASFIISQSPLITAVFAICFFNEDLNSVRAIGFIISIIGIALISIGEKGGFHWDKSLIYILIATILSSCYSVFQKPFLKKYNAIETTIYIIWGGTLFLLFFSPQLHQDLMHASWQATLTVIYLGIFPAAIGYMGWSYALAEIPAARAVSFLYFMPFVATLLGWLLLHEVPAFLSICGGVLAIIGVWVINQSYKRQLFIKLESQAVINN